MSQVERMAGSRALFAHVVKMTAFLSAPRVLNQTFEWHRETSAAER